MCVGACGLAVAQTVGGSRISDTVADPWEEKHKTATNLVQASVSVQAAAQVLTLRCIHVMSAEWEEQENFFVFIL